MDNIIEHHGVKGQRWGVKRKRYSESLSDEDHVVKKGSEITRVSSKKNEKLDRFSSYVTTTNKDSDEYTGNYAGLLDRAYKMKMSNTNDLISPSARKRASIYMDAYKNDPAFRRSFALSVKKTTIPGSLGFGGSKKTYLKRYGHLTDDQLDSKKMLRKISTTMAVSQKVRDTVLNKALEKGYNSFVDDHDAGHYAREPLIVIDAKRNLKLDSVSKITEEEIKSSFNRALQNARKRRKSKELSKDFKSVGIG